MIKKITQQTIFVSSEEKCLIVPSKISISEFEKGYKIPDFKSSVGKSSVNTSATNSPKSERKIDKISAVDENIEKIKSKRQYQELLALSPANANKRMKQNINRPKVIKECEKTEKEIAAISTELKELTVSEEKIEKEKKIEIETKNLEVLANKWREACCEALVELKKQFEERGNDPNEVKLSKLIQQLGIDPNLLHFNIEMEDFE